MVNTRTFEPGLESYVLPSQCEQVFYCEVPGKPGWSFVVRYDPTWRPVKHHVHEEVLDIGEEYDAEVKQDVANVSDEEPEEVEPNMGDNVHDDDVQDDTIESDIDDDIDMVNPLIIDSKLDDMPKILSFIFFLI